MANKDHSEILILDPPIITPAISNHYSAKVKKTNSIIVLVLPCEVMQDFNPLITYNARQLITCYDEANTMYT